MAQQDFKTCIMVVDEDGDYKCSLKRNGVWIHTFGKTEMDAFHSMFELIQEMIKNK